MNQHTTHRLRDLWTPPADGARAAWRQFKRDYNAIPRSDRHRFMTHMAAIKTAMAKPI